MVYYNNGETITFQTLVMKQIQKIQDITSKELRDGEKIIKNLIGEQIIESEDTRHSYLQSVDMLGSLLSPYFDNNVKSNFQDFCNLVDIELIEALEDKDFIKEIERVFEDKGIKKKVEEGNSIKAQVNIYLLNYKIKEGRKMFRKLVKLFKDNDFLGNQEFADSDVLGGSMEFVDEGGDNQFKIDKK